jgi:hypothetical protein
MRSPEQFFLAALCVLAAAVPVLLPAGAVLLRAACWLCRAKEPGFGRAMGVVSLLVFVLCVGDLVLTAVLAAFMGEDAWEQDELVYLSQILSLPLYLVLSAGVLSSTLDGVRFGRGLAVGLVFLLLATALAVLMGLVYLMFSLAQSLR